MKKLFLLGFIILLSMSVSAANQTSAAVDITVFYGETCPHCHDLFDFLDELDEEGYNFNLIKYEVWSNKSNQELAQNYSDKSGIQFLGVPTFFIANESYSGYSESMDSEIIAAIGHLTSKDTFIEKYDLDKKSLPLLAIFLGFIDGFNPCAFFVLFFLLSMLVYAKSKKRMLLIGGIFVFVSGFIYFIFMSAWLNFFLVARSLNYMTLIAGILALIIGLINVKDFFIFKKGVSLSISNKNRGKLMKKMRSLLKASSLPSMIIGTILLAISANLYELLCTAGFPMVFTKILTENNLSSLSYYSYIGLYNVFYVIPLFVIVLFFTFTFNAKKLSETQGESLKLLSGFMMVSLGGLLVFSPGALTNMFAAVGIILSVIVLTAIVVYFKSKLNKSRKTKK